eukprot:1026888-Karenia_brevis.AAC.1
MLQYADGVRPSNSSGIVQMLPPPAGDPKMRPAGPPSLHPVQSRHTVYGQDEIATSSKTRN